MELLNINSEVLTKISDILLEDWHKAALVDITEVKHENDPCILIIINLPGIINRIYLRYRENYGWAFLIVGVSVTAGNIPVMLSVKTMDKLVPLLKQLKTI